MSRDVLIELERSDAHCIMRFADGNAFRVSYVKIRSNCQCAKSKPRQENEQRKLELEEEILRLRVEKPKATQSGDMAYNWNGPRGAQAASTPSNT